MENLIKSREFWLMIVGAIVSVLVAFVPQLESVKVELINAIMVIVMIIVGFIGAEKVAAARASGATKIERMSK